MALDLSAALTRCPYTAGSPDRPNPLLRNTNTGGAYDETKAGPRAVLKRGAGDWVMLWESGGTSATSTSFATSGNIEDWAKFDGNPVIVPSAGAWQNSELSPSSLLWDPVGGRYLLYGHGGNNTGPRQIFVASSADLKSWTILNSGNPIVPNGTSGQWDDANVSDCKVLRISASDWVMYYRGWRATSQTARIGHATSSDGITWTKYGSNPVISPGAGGQWDDGEIIGPSLYLDPDGVRIHVWYAGVSAGNVQAIGYARTDNRTTFTKGASNPVLTKNTDTSAPDADANGIGDTIEVVPDGDKLYVIYGTDRVTGYVVAPLRAMCGSYIPLPAVGAQARPGRFFTQASTDQIAPGGAAYLLNDSVFTIAARFKMPAWTTHRYLYFEVGNFDETCYLKVGTTGLLSAWYRTPGTSNWINEIFSAGRVDDNRWHNVSFRRTAINNFDLILDGVVLGSGVQPTPANPTATMTRTIGSDPSGPHTCHGTISRIAIVEGTAWTTAQIDAFLNGGPAASTPSWWYDLGTGSTEPDKSGNGSTGTVTGTTVVNADPVAGSFVAGLAATSDPAGLVTPWLRGPGSFALKERDPWPVLAATVAADATATPATITGTGAIQAPTLVVTVTPGTIAGTGNVNGYADTYGDIYSEIYIVVTSKPSTIAGTGSVQTPVETVTVFPATINGTGAIQTPTEVEKPTPATITGTGQIQAPVGVVIAFPATIAGTGAIQAPTVSAGGNVTVTPTTIAGTGAVQTPVVVVTALPGTIAGTGAIQTPTETGSPTPATIAGTGAIQAPVVKVVALPATITGTGAIQAPTVSAGGSATVTPATINGTGGIQAPSFQVVAVATTITGSGLVFAPIIAVKAQPQTLVGVGAVQSPTVVGDAVGEEIARIIALRLMHSVKGMRV